jgi:mRNA interferase MazF
MICKTFDSVLVPFSFTESAFTKKRPALVLSHMAAFNIPANHTILAMITSAQHVRWPLDTVIIDICSAGLSKECVIRVKLFTLDNHLIIKKIGTLNLLDQKLVQKNFSKLWAFNGK